MRLRTGAAEVRREVVKRTAKTRRKGRTKKAARTRTARARPTRRKRARRPARKKVTSRRPRRKPVRRKVARKRPAPRKTRAARPPAARRAVRPASRRPRPAPATAATAAAAATGPETAQLGRVVHYFARPGAAIVQVEQGEIRVGDTLRFFGHTTDFQQRIDRIEIDHQPVERATAGQTVGIHVSERTREHDRVGKVVET
jgi:hypothetical protein